MARARSAFARTWPPIAVFVLAAVALEVYVRAAHVPKFLLAPPSAVGQALVNDRNELAASTLTTAEAACIGFAASGVVGVIAAVALASSRLVRRAFYPYTLFFQTIPIVAIAPMLVIWFDAGLASVAITAFIVSVFPVIAATLAGLLGTDPALDDLFTLYRAGFWGRLWKLRLPSAVPDILTGLRVAAGLAVIGTVVGEFLVGLLGSGAGLGVKIVSAKKYGRIDEMLAAVLLASLLGLALFGAVNLAGHLMLRRWHASERE